MKRLFNVALLLLLVMFNSCEIAQKPQQIQINKLFSEQQLQKDERAVILKTKPNSAPKQLQIAMCPDTVTKPTLVKRTSTKNIFTQNQVFKNFAKLAVDIPIKKIKTISYSLLKPSSREAGFTKNTNTESNVFSKLALLFLILGLCLIIFTFADMNGLALYIGGLLIIVGLFLLFLCLVFFILGLIFREKSE